MALECRPDGTFVLLQLTDFHLDGGHGEAERTWRAAGETVSRIDPDFLAFTGDIWCGDDAPALGTYLFHDSVRRMASFGKPWAFCRGNHDYAADWSAAERALAAAPGWALPFGDGRGNGRCEVTRDGEALWDIFFLDSGMTWAESRGVPWMAGETKRLAEERGRAVPAVAFFHIPLGAYERVRVTGAFEGTALEEVLCWGDEEDRLAGAIADTGAVRAAYCGHSHRNDFTFRHRDVRFAYGRTSGYGGYGELEKGAKKIVLHADGAVSDATALF